MTHLQELRLGGCRELQGRALLALTALRDLSCLELNGCPHIESIVLPSIIDAMSSLQCLQLRRLKGHMLEKHLCNVSRVPGMLTLSLDHCSTLQTDMPTPGTDAVHQQLLSSLQALTLLEGLQLWNNNALCMSLPGCTVLGTLRRLTRVNIRPCAVTDSLLESMAPLTNLHSLELADCTRVSDFGLQHLSALSTLQNLDLYDAPLVGDEGLGHIAGCTHLLSFRIRGCRITDQSLSYIIKWKNLRNLSLTGAHNISDAGVMLLPALTSLKILDLADCRHITDEGLQYLSVMGELRQINLEACRQITNLGVQHFRAKMLAAGPPGFEGSGGGIVVYL
jgi:F-box and leucine-rich repeat protein 14